MQIIRNLAISLFFCILECALELQLHKIVIVLMPSIPTIDTYKLERMEL